MEINVLCVVRVELVEVFLVMVVLVPEGGRVVLVESHMFRLWAAAAASAFEGYLNQSHFS